MSQLFLSIVPDRASLATLSLLVTYIIFFISLYKRRIPSWLWLAAGVFSLGVTTTNFIQTLICFFIAQVASGKPMPKAKGVVAKNLIIFGGGVLLFTAGLALIQKTIYPSSTLFFLPSVFKVFCDSQYRNCHEYKTICANTGAKSLFDKCIEIHRRKV